MTLPRPLAQDSTSSSGAPVVVARQTLAASLPRARVPVTHSYAALAFYTAGESRLELNGTYHLRSGDLLLVPAGEPHRLLEHRNAAFWGLSLCAPCFAAQGSGPLLEPFERVRDGGSAVVAIPRARRAYLEGLFEELERVSGVPVLRDTKQEIVQKSLLNLICAEVDAAHQPSSVTPSPRSNVAGAALRYIERHCLAPLTLAAVARAVGRSPAHVTTVLTRATGRSALQWIISGRMAEARRLLLHSDERVETVAERIGYADPTHFIRIFRRAHGVTPSAFRAGLRALPSTPTPASARR